MRMEARLGEKMGITRAGVGARLDEVLAGCGLPEVLEPPLDLDEVLDRARPDKKSRGGVLRWVLLEDVGIVAPGPDGDVTHAIPSSACREPLQAALREAFQAADSSA
jgi:3-dehydroquinate synthetase